jgi:murein DD-endopeptidase MepM/ murein hydrolase activator NlpD
MRCASLTVSQGFGDTRWEHPHRGIDIVCPPRTRVLSVAAGIFRRYTDLSSACLFVPGRTGGYGIYGIVTAADGTQFLYGHLDGYALADLARVQPGTVLGFEGSSGCSSGPHLHFEVRRRGRAVNPCGYLPPGYPFTHDALGRCWGSAEP